MATSPEGPGRPGAAPGGTPPPGDTPTPAPTPPFTLRRADGADCRFVWATRNEPSARAASLSPDPIPFDEHQAWWARALADPATAILVIEVPGRGAVGYVRFRREPGEGAPGSLGDASEISIALAPEARGLGLGAAAIRAAGDAELARRGGPRRILARVRPENAASLAAFAAAGFAPAGASAPAVSAPAAPALAPGTAFLLLVRERP